MTGKEALKELQEILEPYFIRDANLKITLKNAVLFSIIEKDLEILDILKDYQILNVIGLDSDKEKVERWLNGK